MDQRGVLYFLAANGNRGRLHSVHLRVSVHSMRQNSWQGPVHIACGDEAGEETARAIQSDERSGQVTWSRVAFDPSSERAYSGKTRMQEWSRFESTVYVDADTVFAGDIEPLWATDARIVLTQFSSWTSNGKKVSGRIDSWREFVPEMVEKAHSVELPAINTGVASFTKACKFFPAWRSICAKSPKMWIGDESAAQVLIACRSDWRCVDGRFNASPTYGPHEDARIVHFHGMKVLKKPEVRAKFEPYLESAKRDGFAGITEVLRGAGVE